MTNVDFKKMILSQEILRCKGHIGAEMINSIENGDLEYTEILNKVNKNLESCVDLLKYRGEQA